jgi:hypothetical protein
LCVLAFAAEGSLCDKLPAPINAKKPRQRVSADDLATMYVSIIEGALILCRVPVTTIDVPATSTYSQGGRTVGKLRIRVSDERTCPSVKSMSARDEKRTCPLSFDAVHESVI